MLRIQFIVLILSFVFLGQVNAVTMGGVSCTISNPKGARTSSVLYNGNSLPILVNSVNYVAYACAPNGVCNTFQAISPCGSNCVIRSLGALEYVVNTSFIVPFPYSVVDNDCSVNFSY